MLVGLAESEKSIPSLPVSPKAEEGGLVHLAVALAKADSYYSPLACLAEGGRGVGGGVGVLRVN